MKLSKPYNFIHIACLRDENYSVEWRMINAADYF